VARKCHGEQISLLSASGLAGEFVWMRFAVSEHEFVLTCFGEVPIVRPPFGKSNDFLESIPSKFSIFRQVDPQPVSFGLFLTR